jgi:hypothetical protein
MVDVASSFLPRLAPSGPFLTNFTFFGLTSAKFVDPATIVPLAQQTGTPEHPFATLAQGVAALPSSGGTLFCAPAQSYPAEALNIVGKPVTIYSPASVIGTGPDMHLVSFTSDSTLSIQNIATVGPVDVGGSAFGVFDCGQVGLGLIAGGLFASNVSIDNATIAGSAQLENVVLSNASIGGALRMTGGQVGQSVSAVDLAQINGAAVSASTTLSCGTIILLNVIEGWDAGTNISGITECDETTYQQARSAGNLKQFEFVLGTVVGLFTVTVPALAAGKVGVVAGYDVSANASFGALSAGLGAMLLGTPVAATLAPGAPDCGFLATVVVDGPHTVSWVFVGPTTGGDADFNLALLNSRA